MSLADTLREHIAACFPGLWITTVEQEEAEAEIMKTAFGQEWTVATWNSDRGLTTNNGSDPDMTDPLAVLRMLPRMATVDGTAILVMRNLQHYTSSPEISQAIETQLVEGKARRTFLIVLAPTVNLPAELERGFVVIEHGLPDRQQLETIARQIGSEEGDLPEGPDFEALIDASAGLTRMEAEGAYSLSLVRHGKIRPQEVWSLKAQTLKKSGLMTLHEGRERFEDLGGLDALKTFCSRSLRPERPRHVKPRGVLLLGVPGTGKSAIAKALGNETGRPTLTLDIGALMGSLVGQTERNVREALRIADAMAPAILFIDEIEKGLSGVGGSSDSGVATRLFGTLLTWMNDHESDVFMIATSNDVSKLPPEFSRAERFDALFFLDFPDAAGRARIWDQYEETYQIPKYDRANRPNDADWTGAEIKACCRLAALLDVTLIEAAKNIVPIASTAAEKVHTLRTWAHGRCLSADRPGIYQSTIQPGTPTTTTTKTKTRKIERPRNPEDN
jgi:hypothetical protein